MSQKPLFSHRLCFFFKGTGLMLGLVLSVMPGAGSFAQNNIQFTVDLTAYHAAAKAGYDSKKVLSLPISEALTGGNVALISVSHPLSKGQGAELADFKPYFNRSPLTLPYIEGPRNVTPAIRVWKGRDANQAYITFLPGQWTSLSSFQLLDSIRITLRISNDLEVRNNPPKYADNSILRSVPTYKISTKEAGMYRIDNQLLSSLGVNTASIDPAKIRMFTTQAGPLPELNSEDRVDDLKEIAIQVVGGDDGKWDNGDYIIFYSPGCHRWNKTSDSTLTRKTNIYDDFKYFFLQFNEQAGKRIRNIENIQGFDLETDRYDYVDRYEVDKINLLREYSKIGAGQVWLDELIQGTNRTRDLSGQFNVDHLVAGDTGTVAMAFAVRCKVKSVIKMIADGQSSDISFSTTNIEDSEARVAFYNSRRARFRQNGNFLKISFEFPQVAAESLGWMDYAEINVKRYLVKPNGQMPFRLTAPAMTGNIRYNLSGLSSDDVVWDVTDMFSAGKFNTAVSAGTMYITAPYTASREFICFRPSELKYPERVGLVAPQNIHGLTTPAMVIVYHSKFAEEARQYAAYRSSKSGMLVHAIDVEQIKNEFSGGAQDPTGIRDMARMFYTRDPHTFRYILMFGDGSYDYKGLTFTAASNKENTNYVPVYEYPRSLFEPIRSIPSDDYFGFMDDNEGEIENGLIDVFVGRFPIQDKSQAQTIFNKVKAYEADKTSFGDWRNNLMLIADDWDDAISDNFIVQSESLYTKVKKQYPALNISKIYLDIYKQEATLGGESYPTAVTEMNDQYNYGVLVSNYIGHGGVDGLAQEKIIDRITLNGMKNSNRLPLLITGTCSFSTYDDPDITSVGKLCITKPNGGMIALMTTTRSVYIGPNETFINKLFQILYSREEGRYLSNGEILAKAKNNSTGADRLAFVLLGDPSMTLAFPHEKVILESMNGKNIEQEGLDTIRALEQITLGGSVRNQANELIDDFNGTLTLTVYDKEYKVYSKGNDGNGANQPVTFQNNIIFKGKASVVNGRWNITFYSPKDINYAIDSGKLSFYAENGLYDAGGYDTRVRIGGESQNPIVDNLPPVIELFMNDLNFVSGATVNTTPMLIAKLSDDYGINVSSSSIGHEIVSTLNNDATKEKIMNDFYTAEKDDYKKGEVKYQFDQLSPGNYTLKLRAWDIANNRSETEIEFVVSNSEQNAISNLLNYPNPFTTSTAFMFEYDSQNNSVQAEISIYSVSGKLIKTITEPLSPNGKRFRTSTWDGLDDYGDRLAKGVYIYKVKIFNSLDTSKKVITSDFQKLVLLK